MGTTINNESTTTESCDASAAALWFQGHNLNNFGRGQLGDATYRKSRLYAFGFLTTRLFVFHIFTVTSDALLFSWIHWHPFFHSKHHRRTDGGGMEMR